MNNKILGDLGEKIVKKYLQKLGCKIIKTNFLCKQGEIDIIASDQNEIVFIEVKTRVNKNFGYPIDAVNYYKQTHIKKAAKYFVYKYKIQETYIRFDIIEVYAKENKYYINHIKNVLW